MFATHLNNQFVCQPLFQVKMFSMKKQQVQPATRSCKCFSKTHHTLPCSALCTFPSCCTAYWKYACRIKLIKIIFTTSSRNSQIKLAFSLFLIPRANNFYLPLLFHHGAYVNSLKKNKNASTILPKWFCPHKPQGPYTALWEQLL